jgi:ketosteroid isomerase-like protein
MKHYVLGFLIFIDPLANAMSPDSHPDSTRAAVERFNEAFNRHDVEGVMNLMTDDCIFENTNPPPDGARLVGAAAVRAYWQKFFASNPDAHFEAEDLIVAGDRCVVRWIYRKTKDGKPWHLRGVDVFRVRDGKVSEKLSYVKG